MSLIAAGLNDCEVARATGIPRGTIKNWRHGSRHRELQLDQRGRRAQTARKDCPICEGGTTDSRAYAYLLGIYLGDGGISTHARGVERLTVTLDTSYPRIIQECARAMRGVRPATEMRVGKTIRPGCIAVYAYWKHWSCLFPQHGPGPKHLRAIRLSFWQERLLERFPEQVLRGLIHSDGCRSLNVVKGRAYPRYQFTNNSDDIRNIFCRACDVVGIGWRRMNWKTISVARKKDVAALDLFIGPKHGRVVVTIPTLPLPLLE